MLNREWINTLSDEEFANIFEPNTGTEPYCETDYTNCHKKPRGSNEWKCYDCLLPWLSQPHETTADEDFASIGFNKNAEKQRWAEYEDKVGKKYTMFKDGTEFFEGGVFKGNLIDQIRTIAQKKRKEERWGE